MKPSLSKLFLLLLLCALCAACARDGATAAPVATASPSAHGGQPSTALQLSGLLKQPASLSLANLQSFPKVSVSVNAKPIGAHTFAGTLLYDVLQQAGVVTESARKNDLLRKAVVVTGSDGYAVAIAWGELDPAFAQKKILLAYEEDGKPLPAADGFARLVVPGDLMAGRYVSNVVSVLVRDPGVWPAPAQRQATSAFFLVGQLKTPARYDLAALKALKTSEVIIKGVTYSGVLLDDLLQHAGMQLKAKKNDFLHKGIVAVGSDGYSCVIADGEIQPHFGNVQILVAFAANGKPLAESDGFARIVVPGDQKMGRFISNLQELQVVELAA
ncbi:molybdopterin-dependent oxidoreductase [Ktedonosporobacter rubrisoli]|uniref:molybdopterin-dependent oxidoreductase n=1 Tax=Ktedonosporobacter rubrisoli TaxID=2509675 RepID=UPI0013EE67C7|nr:molybdopterin-dependent oxidoreductase [Ktedonosporobacter rubrisoli]